jgi:thioredoxin reductase (NADPH)
MSLADVSTELSQPTIVVVDDDTDTLSVVEKELRRRYAADYRIICVRSAMTALQLLREAKATGGDAALLLADLWMPEMSGVEFLAQAHDLYPLAKRMLIIRWNDGSASAELLRAMALGQVDSFLSHPWDTPDESFHRSITEALEQWTRLHRPKEVVRIVGEQWAPRSHELRDLLNRNSIPYGFYDRHSDEGQVLLRHVQRPAERFPVLILRDGAVLVDPSNAAIAEVLGARTRPEPQDYDVTIIGAGPAGLSAAVYAASEGLRTLVIEREAMGGQAGTSSLIRNYLGFPWGISGGELASRAFTQAQLFQATFVFTQQVTGLRADGHQRVVVLADGTEVPSRTIVLATGMTYRRLGIPRLDTLTGAGVFYGAAVAEAEAARGQGVFVVGAGNSAGQAAIYIAKYAARVTMLVRGHALAASMSDYLVQEIAACDNIDVRLHTEVVDGDGEHRLQHLVLRDTVSGSTETVAAAALFVLIGAQPHTDWLPATICCDERGYIVTGHDLMRDGNTRSTWSLSRPPLLLETSMPGVFAVGDVRHRSAKRVATAVGEGATAVLLVHEYMSQR